jgi:hypothetical protein
LEFSLGEWEEPRAGAVCRAGGLVIRGRLLRAEGVERLRLFVDGSPALDLPLMAGPDGGLDFEGHFPLNDHPPRLPLSLRADGEDGLVDLFGERVVWRARSWPARPSMPLAAFHRATSRLSSALAVRGRATLGGEPFASVAFWRAGRCLATAEPSGSGDFDVIVTTPFDAVHAWLADADGQEVYAGPVELDRWRLVSDRLTLAVDSPEPAAEARVRAVLGGPDASRATVCVNGRLALAEFAGGLDGEDARPDGPWRHGPLAFVEAFVDGRLIAREPVFRPERTVFAQFQKALKSRRRLTVVLASGEEWPKTVPLKMVSSAKGWRFFLRRPPDREPLELGEEEIAGLRITPAAFSYVSSDREFRQSFKGQDDRTIGGAAWRPLARPAVLPSGVGAPIAKPGPVRVVIVRAEALPTDEIYIAEPLRSLVAAGDMELVFVDTDDEEIEGLACGETIAPGDVVIVVRYATSRWLRRLAAAKPGVSIVYLMDDDFLAAIDTPGLPQPYRRRMADVARFDLPAMLALADRVVVTSDYLARAYASPKTALLEPPWIRCDVGLDHHAAGGLLHVGYHGTNSHADDLEMIAPALISALDACPHARLELFSASAAVGRLGEHARVDILAPVSWADYKRHAVENPCHVTLAPMLDTPYNAGKSIIKFLDAASSGAVGVYSDLPPYHGFVEHGRDGFLAANDPDCWSDTLIDLLHAPGRLAEAARACRETAGRRRPVAAATAFWRELLIANGG